MKDHLEQKLSDARTKRLNTEVAIRSFNYLPENEANLQSNKNQFEQQKKMLDAEIEAIKELLQEVKDAE